MTSIEFSSSDKFILRLRDCDVKYVDGPGVNNSDELSWEDFVDQAPLGLKSGSVSESSKSKSLKSKSSSKYCTLFLEPNSYWKHV